MRVLFWKEDKKRPAYSGKRFNLFRVRWDKRLRKTVKTEKGERWGFYHPLDDRIIMLRKDPSRYGKVIETPDISVSAVLGEPTLEVLGKPLPNVVDSDESSDEENNENHDGT